MFTKEDVESLCTKYKYPDNAISLLESRYGGYVINGRKMFNSFSVIQFVQKNSEFNLTTVSKVSVLWNDFHSWHCLHVSDKIKISKAKRYIWLRVLDFPDKHIEL